MQIKVSEIFKGMTREELREIARAANIPRGQNRVDTEANIMAAVLDGKLTVRVFGTVSCKMDREGLPPLQKAINMINFELS